MTTIQEIIEDAKINRQIDLDGKDPIVTVEEIIRLWTEVEEGNTDDRISKEVFMDLQSELTWALILFAEPQLLQAPPQTQLNRLLERQAQERAELQKRQADERIYTGLFTQDDGVQTPTGDLKGPMIILGDVQA